MYVFIKTNRTEIGHRVVLENAFHKPIVTDPRPVSLFTLRSLETNQAAVQALIDALAADSSLSSSSADDDGGDDDAHQKLSSLHADALFSRHEVAFALGQMRAKAAIATPAAENQREHGVTRHASAGGARAYRWTRCRVRSSERYARGFETTPGSEGTASLALEESGIYDGSRDESTHTVLLPLLIILLLIIAWARLLGSKEREHWKSRRQ